MSSKKCKHLIWVPQTAAVIRGKDPLLEKENRKFFPKKIHEKWWEKHQLSQWSADKKTKLLIFQVFFFWVGSTMFQAIFQHDKQLEPKHVPTHRSR